MEREVPCPKNNMMIGEKPIIGNELIATEIGIPTCRKIGKNENKATIATAIIKPLTKPAKALSNVMSVSEMIKPKLSLNEV